ncbi:MAG: beta-galactosidase trimerization domain-containing protein, partial [Armatimonadota bacterium]
MAGARFPLTTTPFTYILDYGGYAGHLDEPDALVQRIADAPPHLLHVAHDTPIPNTAGPVVLLGDDAARRLSVEEMRDRTARIADMVRRIHAVGVKTFIPYICNQTIAGDPKLRRGVWEFYDHWDEYLDLEIGPRPEADSLHWLARERNGRPHFNYEMRHEHFTRRGMFRFAPCVNNPYYNAYQRVIVTAIARVGYDGVFVDNCILNCYCEYCRERFRGHLASTYSPEELRRRFGIADPQQIEPAYRGSRLEWVKEEPTFKKFLADTFSDEELIRWLGTADLNEARLEEGGNGWLWGRAHDYRKWMEQHYAPRELEKMFGSPDLSQWGVRTAEERALWSETKLFWAESIRHNLAFIKQVGSEVRGDFYILPNWGAMLSFDATEFREEIAHDVETWAPAMDAMMYEEDGDAGRVAHGFYVDHLLQQKLALALGVAGTVMSSRGANEGADELAHAQALAAGGGAYIQLTSRFPHIRARYRAFFDGNAELLAGLRSYAHVAIGCFFRELHMENHSHLRQVYQISRYLADQHVLFDLIVERQLTADVLRDYDVLILPEARYLSDDGAAAVEEFAASGGLVVLTGESGCCDDAGKPRHENAFAEPFAAARRGASGLRSSRDGRWVHAVNVASLIGADNISREDALDFAMYSAASLNVPAGRSAAAVYELDRMIGVDRYYDRARLIPWIERGLGYRIRLADGRRAAGVRFHAYRGDDLMLLHAVNYNVPVPDDPRGRP